MHLSLKPFIKNIKRSQFVQTGGRKFRKNLNFVVWVWRCSVVVVVVVVILVVAYIQTRSRHNTQYKKDSKYIGQVFNLMSEISITKLDLSR